MMARPAEYGGFFLSLSGLSLLGLAGHRRGGYRVGRVGPRVVGVAVGVVGVVDAAGGGDLEQPTGPRR
jgi:hypothetical protein